MDAKPTAKKNFLFFKANPQACFDLTKYTAIRFDMQAPGGSDAKFTLTQKDVRCKERIVDGDSVYQDISKYAKMDGKKKRVVMPLTEYARRSKDGKPFDFAHFKDFTIVDMKPVGAQFKFSNIWLVGNCKKSSQTIESKVDGKEGEGKKEEAKVDEKLQQAAPQAIAATAQPAAAPVAEEANKVTTAPAQETLAANTDSFAPSLYELAWAGLTGLAAAMFL